MTMGPSPKLSLLAYADRLGGDIDRLAALLDGPLRAFGGVHVLPFFTPFDGDDAGFDPVDHATVDPRLGDWSAVRRLACGRELTADLIVNHISADSTEFTDWLRNGSDSRYDGMFLTLGSVFPNGVTESELAAFYRPRPGLPVTPYESDDRARHLVWTTFMPTQVDLDVAHPAALRYLDNILATFADNGVTTVRLDAVGYAVKTPGTDSFMTSSTLEFVADITARVRSAGMRVLVEVHAHYTQQLAIAPLVDLVYDFGIAPLILHSWITGSVDRLDRWMQIRPDNAIVVLDTHDGIGIIDAGPIGERPGLISQEEMAAIFTRAGEMTDGHSDLASVIPTWFEIPHQINATYLDVLGGDADRYLAARALQMFLPGEPQIYYVGLLGGHDDRNLFAATGNGRDVNRHVYTDDEIASALDSTITRALLTLVRMRAEHRAFAGTMTHSKVDEHRLRITWTNDDASARLDWSAADDLSFTIELVDGDEREHFTRAGDLATRAID